jgi:hypothetical protein
MRVIVAACGRAKRDRAAPAADLYVGRYARVPIDWAMSVDPAALVILSAKYGLVRPDDVLEPYNLRMGDPGSVTARRVRQQADDMGLLAAADVHVLPMAAPYLRIVAQVWPHAKRLFRRIPGVHTGGAVFTYIQSQRGRDVRWVPRGAA